MSGHRDLRVWHDATENGREALEMLRGGMRPCLIVLDLTMPVMNGFEFRYEQQRDPAIADIPVIVTSAVSLRDTSTQRRTSRNQLKRKRSWPSSGGTV